MASRSVNWRDGTVRYMDRPRIDFVSGVQERSALRLMGCVIEVA